MILNVIHMAKKSKIITMRFSEKEVQLLEALKKEYYDVPWADYKVPTSKFFKTLMRNEALKMRKKIPPELLS